MKKVFYQLHLHLINMFYKDVLQFFLKSNNEIFKKNINKLEFCI